MLVSIPPSEITGMIRINRLSTIISAHFCRTLTMNWNQAIRLVSVRICWKLIKWFWLEDQTMVWSHRGNLGALCWIYESFQSAFSILSNENNFFVLISVTLVILTKKAKWFHFIVGKSSKTMTSVWRHCSKKGDYKFWASRLYTTLPGIRMPVWFESRLYHIWIRLIDLNSERNLYYHEIVPNLCLLLKRRNEFRLGMKIG